jgi:hypothetical protein
MANIVVNDVPIAPVVATHASEISMHEQRLQ